MIRSLIQLAGIALLTACAVTPDDDDSINPEITISQMKRGSIVPILKTDGSDIFDSPDVCPDGQALVGWVWQVDSWPVELLVSASDRGGIEWLRVHTTRGEFSSPEPPSVVISRSRPPIEAARAGYPASDPRSPRVFSVKVSPRPGETVVDIEGGASDTNGNDVYTVVMQVGTNEALCEMF